jgi:hypothetical protein
MDKTPRYRTGFMTLLFIIVMVGQYLSTTYMQRDFDAKLQQCYEAVNQNTLLLTALINKLQEKNIVVKSDIILGAQALSSDLKTLLQKQDAAQQLGSEQQPAAASQKQQ